MTKGRQGSYKYFQGSSAGGDLILSGWNLDDKGNDVCGAGNHKRGSRGSKYFLGPEDQDKKHVES